MKKPVSFDEKSQIKIVAPASPVKKEFLKRGIERVKGFFPQFTFSEVIFKKDFFFAGSDEERASDLNVSLNNFDFVWCARGGYGSMRLIDKIRLKRKTFPIVIGSSDVTSLLLFLTQRYNFITFYGPMIAGELSDLKKEYDLAFLRDILTGRKGDGEKLFDGEIEEIISGNVEGVITGGCLSLVASTLGTPYEIDTDDRILFLEDVNVKPYALDRMFTQMRYGGKFKSVRAILFGEMVNCIQNENQGYDIRDLIYANFKELGIPVYFGFPAGHTLTGGTFIPIGGRVEIRNRKVYLKEDLVC